MKDEVWGWPFYLKMADGREYQMVVLYYWGKRPLH